MIGTKSQSQRWTSKQKTYLWSKDLFFLTLWYVVYFLFMLGSRHLSIPDEGRYPEIAREMLSSGNWVTPTINGVPFLDKPILYYWLEAISMKFFGINAWAIRLPQALFGMIGCLSLYSFVRVLYTREVALLSSLILSVSVLYFFAAHYANMDLIVANLLWMSFFFFLSALRLPYPSSKRRLLMYCAYLFAAFAFLTKGLMGIVFPAMVIFIWMLFTNNWHLLKKMYLPTGLILFVAVIMPWLLLVQNQNPSFFYFFFYYQQFERFVGGGFNNQMGIWFYFAIVFLAFLPFSLLLMPRVIPGLLGVWINRYKDQTTCLIQLWVILIFIFFSIPSSKIVGYILPIIGPLAVLISLAFQRIFKLQIVPKQIKIMHIFTAFLFLIVTIGLLIYPSVQHKFVSSRLYLSFIPTAIGALGVFLSVFFTFKNQFKRAVYLIILAMMFLNLSALTAIPIYDKKTSEPLIQTIKPYMTEQTVYVAYDRYWEDLALLLKRNVYIVLPWGEKEFQYDNWAREFDFGIKQYQSANDGKLPQYFIEQKGFLKLWNSHNHIIVFMDQSKLNQFRQTFHDSVAYGQYNNIIAVGKATSN